VGVTSPSTNTGAVPPFRARVCAPPRSPLVLSVPHAGVSTAGFDAAMVPSLDVRNDADLFVDRLYGVAADAPAPEGAWTGPYVVANLSRFVCDMNRDPDDVSAQAVPQHPAPRNADGRGFIWAVTTDGRPTMSRPLTLGEWQARQAVHAAYHEAIREALRQARARFGFAVLLDGHSMPSVGRTGHKDPGRPRADIVPGDRDGTSCAPALSRLVESHFRARGYSVAFNEPYKGGFITAHHGRPHDDIHAIQIELRRDLYMDESQFTLLPAGAARLQQTLRELLTALDTFRPT
jgi:N-formylglutamate amidohydrolase